MQKLNSILLLDRTGKKCEFGIYNKRPLLHLSSKLNLYIPFFITIILTIERDYIMF